MSPLTANRTIRRLVSTGTLAIALSAGAASSAEPSLAPSPAVAAIQAEVARARSLELPGMPRPHHVAVTLLGERETVVEASLGAILKQDHEHARIAKVEVRVGDASFDSSNFLGTAEEPVVLSPAALQDEPQALRRTIWLLADQAYKNATETFEAKRAHFESMAGGQDGLADFSDAPVEHWRAEAIAPVPEPATYTSIVQAVSRVFARHPTIHRSVVRVVAHTRTRVFVDSAGSSIEDATSLLRFEIVAQTQADDGMVLVDHDAFCSSSFSDLPSVESLVKVAEALAERLEATRVAAVVDDYAGPVLFEGIAAPQALRYLLADELSGTPAPEPSLGSDVAMPSSLSSRIGWRVLPLGFDVIDDPTRAREERFR